MIRSIDKVLGGCSVAFAIAAGMGLVFLTFATSFDALWRKVGGRPLPGVVDYGELVLVAVTFFGIAYAQRRGLHISADVVANRLPERVAKRLEAIGLTLVLVFVAAGVYATGTVAYESYTSGEYRFGLTRVTVWPARAVIPLSLLVLALELVRNILMLLGGDESRHSFATHQV